MPNSTASEALEPAHQALPVWDAGLDWLPVGMAWIDSAGTVLRSNRAFQRLTGFVCGPLEHAPSELQQLLGWPQAAVWHASFLDSSTTTVLADLPAFEASGRVTPAGGGSKRLKARLHRQQASKPAAPAYLAPHLTCVIEDLQTLDERDLARLQLETLIEAAGAGLATFSDAASPSPRTAVEAGNRASQPPQAMPRVDAASSLGLQSISRDTVSAATLPEFERVKKAIKHGEQVDARYAIEHPELGTRWLYTHVEPGNLASGERTTSVVTLDVTKQIEAQHRSERLLHELTTILESSPAGIAYVRGRNFVRSNRRFERMLALAAGSTAGAHTQQTLAHVPHGLRLISETETALKTNETFETEVGIALPNGGHVWYALSVRRLSAPDGGEVEAIAVLTDITRRKLQQLELEAMARDRELMFNLSGVGIAFVQHGLIQRANAALSLLLGRPGQSLTGMEWTSLYAQGQDAGGTQASTVPPRPDHDWSAEHALRRADSSRVWVQITQRLVDPAQPDAGVIVSCVNVDDRHRAEQVVTLQAERTRAILDSVFVGIVTVGDRGIEWMNRSARRMFGGDLADFFNQPISTVATQEPEHPFRDTAYLQQLLEGQAHTFECQVMARDGRTFWVVGNAVVTTGQRGRRQITYALLDIERRRQAEARTAEAQASLQRIIEMAPLAITLRDARTLRVLQMNQLAASIAGMPRNDAIGKTPEDIYPSDVAASMHADMDLALSGGQVLQREYRTQHDGNLQIWDARYLPLSKPGLPPDQLLLVATDVTDQRAAEKAKLQAAITQRDLLVREVHHRIKNNLQGVAGLLQQIAAKKPEVAPAISEVVGQVQAIAQVYGLQVGSGGPLKLRSVIEAIAQSVQRTFGRPIALSVTGDCAHEWMLPEAESIPIALCMNELLANAIKHGAPGDIQCSLACNEAAVRVEINSPGTLPPDFSLDRFPGGVSGLGLVRALLPRRSAQFSLTQNSNRVLATIDIKPPGVSRLMPGTPAEEPTGQQITLWPQ
ncbi:PAS domain S-box protein [Aquabacterium sp.]|uniref:PAS domain S-box protein n=1 Tax=Aquabacterium sp. TaxID=1872578 RepID=UPI0035B07FDB